MPLSSGGVVRLHVGLRVTVAAPEKPFFAVVRLVVPVRHFLRFPAWASALAAAVFEALPVRPSLKTALAAFAARGLVCFLLAILFTSPAK